MDYNKFEDNLIKLIKLFSGRPNHLAKYLIDHNSFDGDFKKLVTNSKILNEMKGDISNLDFNNFKEMNDFFSHIIDDKEMKSKIKLESEMNTKLFELINNEEYEDAAKLRDYMMRKNIKIII